MAVPVIDSEVLTNGGSTDRTTLTLTAPTITVGELLIIVAFTVSPSSGNIFNTPTGWTKIDEIGDGGAVDSHIAAFWKKATGGDTDIAVTHSGTSADMIGWYACVTGADTIAPIDQSHGELDTFNNTQIVMLTPGNLVTTEANTLAIGSGMTNHQSGYVGIGTMTGWTNLSAANSTTATTGFSLKLEQKDIATASNIGGRYYSMALASEGAGLTFNIKLGGASRRIFIS